jgi:regulatory protein
MAPIDGGGREESALAPVIPLFGGERPAHRGTPRSDRARRAQSEPPRAETAQGDADIPWHASWVAPDSARRSTDRRGATDAPSGGDASDAEAVDPNEVRDAAEASLLRKLRTRQLSVSESRGVLIAAGMTGGAADELLDQFERLGYLDDVSLSQQLVRAAVERKGQGRQAISPLLTRRGIPRDVVDAVLSEMPDDDLERALEFARTKARSLGARDRETALRRLLGQLARRGYPSSVSMTAARQALDEL